jgi:uncharacterized protein (TIGR02611 family)
MKDHLLRSWRWLPRVIRVTLVFVVGLTLLLSGLLMLVLPGPGLLVILAALAVLAVEFTWARRMLQRARSHQQQLLERARRRTPSSNPTEIDGSNPRGLEGGSDTI